MFSPDFDPAPVAVRIYQCGYVSLERGASERCSLIGFRGDADNSTDILEELLFRAGEMTGGSARESRIKKSSTRFFSKEINKSSACSQTQSSSCSTGRT